MYRQGLEISDDVDDGGVPDLDGKEKKRKNYIQYQPRRLKRTKRGDIWDEVQYQIIFTHMCILTLRFYC